MSQTKSTIKSYWDKRSSTFDLSPGHRLSGKREEDAWKAFFRDKIGPGEKRALDVGVGTGFLSIILAEMGYSVVGVDISEEMIKIARKKVDARGLNVGLKWGDAEELPFEDGSFDAVVNRAVLWTLPDPRAALNEWMRVLRPGGVLCFFLHGPHKKGGLYHSAGKQISNLATLARERRNPWTSLTDSVDLPMGGGADPSEVKSLLKSAGYVRISCEPMTEIGRLKEEKMPWYRRLSSHGVQYAYSCTRP